MHEASLAANVLKIVSRAAAGKESRVRQITVSVGQLAGVMPDALLFAFEALKKQTLLTSATLKLEKEPVTACCEDCGHEYQPQAFPYTCPICQSHVFRITNGEAVTVKRMEIKKGD
ncbi:MAG: hydrogenase maturation nickel metallochaperone HypA [Oscillospiraceae bacterium]|nr:hydrogenase maturation nickel metallochaperone HypA [Oscillospiraceae bacterium]MDD4368170.1 hydrogenase maturation nickel metallochaperone HypA [Oscillospiraceae bacterium]